MYKLMLHLTLRQREICTSNLLKRRGYVQVELNDAPPALGDCTTF